MGLWGSAAIDDAGLGPMRQRGRCGDEPMRECHEVWGRLLKYHQPMALNERDFFTEKPEMRSMSIACPQCRHRADYQIRWMHRRKKDRIPPGADARDRAMFEKLREHLFRVDDFVNCIRCRRRVEIPSHQSMIFLDELPGNMPDYDE
jgi:DNA-directed RNA polymerase subunit RPC12/RpoP